MHAKRFEELKATGLLPSPTGVGLEILRLTREEGTSAQDIARIIQADPALAGRTLRLANTGNAAASRSVTNVTDAVARLGTRTVSAVALGFTILAGNRSGKCRGFDYQRFWAHSLAFAVAGQILCTKTRRHAATDGFTGGLLAQVGKLALASVHCETYALVLEEWAGGSADQLIRLEQRSFITDHNELSSVMLADWGLPKDICEAVLRHENPSVGDLSDPSSARQMARTLHAASRIADVCVAPNNSAAAALASDLLTRCEAVGLNPDAVFALFDHVFSQWAEWGRVLEIETRKPPNLAELLESGKSIAVPAPGDSPDPAGSVREIASPAEFAEPLKGELGQSAPSESGAEQSATGQPLSEQHAPEQHGPEQLLAGESTSAQSNLARLRPASSSPLARSASSTPPHLTPVPVQAGNSTPAAGQMEEVPSGLLVLVADQDAASLRFLEKFLTLSGHRVRCASGGHEALQVFFETAPQLVILSAALPEIGGLELCRRLRQTIAGRQSYIILLTPPDDEETLTRLFEAGADDFVTKPFAARPFFARIRASLRVIALQQKVNEDRDEIQKIHSELAVAHRRLEQDALTDVLTALPNRRYLIDRLAHEWAAARRGGTPLACMMVDIDNFKTVNDTYGHDVGDFVLQAVAETLQEGVRGTDVVCRLGGEEFVVVSATDYDSAMRGAERLRSAIERQVVGRVSSIRESVTVSIGVAVRNDQTRSAEALLKAADEALFAAKRGGRNRVASNRDRQLAAPQAAKGEKPADRPTETASPSMAGTPGWATAR